MKGILALTLFLLISYDSFSQHTEFKLKFGDQHNNKVQKSKVRGNMTYIISNSILSTTNTNTYISKIDFEGNKIWSKFIGSNIEISDFVFTPTSKMILVGRTLPFADQQGHHDNKSIILQLNSVGNILQSYSYDQSGREGFENIIKHKAPNNINYPYYVSGVKNPDGQGPSHIDQVVLINIDDNLNVNWANRYHYSGSEEFHRELIDLSDGHLVLMGNDEPSNKGMLVKVGGSNGDVITSLRTNLEIDFLNAHNSGSELTIVGALNNSDACHDTNAFGAYNENNGCLTIIKMTENLYLTSARVNPFYNPKKEIIYGDSGFLVTATNGASQRQHVINVDRGFAGYFRSPDYISEDPRISTSDGSYIVYSDSRSSFWNEQSIGLNDIYVTGGNDDFYNFRMDMLTLNHDCLRQKLVTYCGDQGQPPSAFRKLKLLPQNIVVDRINYSLPQRADLGLSSTNSNLIFTLLCSQDYDSPTSPTISDQSKLKVVRKKQVNNKRIRNKKH